MEENYEDQYFTIPVLGVIRQQMQCTQSFFTSDKSQYKCERIELTFPTLEELHVHVMSFGMHKHIVVHSSKKEIFC